ncbi:hypothetical protein OHB53_15225 [Streptomyces sp. NBC_00056]|uniref:hypothetical protein n=1 Tax=Streptomyces sp. NBC_00056 TaxID=2975633 RepID=UPI003251FCD6
MRTTDKKRLRPRIGGLHRTGDRSPALWVSVTSAFATPDTFAVVPREVISNGPGLSRDASELWLGLPDGGRLRIDDIGPLARCAGRFGGGDVSLLVPRARTPTRGVLWWRSCPAWRTRCVSRRWTGRPASLIRRAGRRCSRFCGAPGGSAAATYRPRSPAPGRPPAACCGRRSGLANAPRVPPVDGSTGELDTAGGEEVFTVLRCADDKLGGTVLVVIHVPLMACRVRRTVRMREGRTSAETLRERGGEGEEFTVLDRAGGLRLPRDSVEGYGPRGRVRLTGEAGHVGVWPDRDDRCDG